MTFENLNGYSFHWDLLIGIYLCKKTNMISPFKIMFNFSISTFHNIEYRLLMT